MLVDEYRDALVEADRAILDAHM
jgi:hypothetical protein